MHEICKQCEIRQDCIKKEPINILGFAPKSWQGCVRFSSQRDQDKTFIMSRTGSSERFQTKDGPVWGWMFGSSDKPTDSPAVRFNKFVSQHGDVYILDKQAGRNWGRTGQKFWKK